MQAVRRLYFNFARGSPGIGLLLLRLAAGCTAIVHGLRLLECQPPPESVLTDGLHFIPGVLLIIGLWTPVAGTLFALLELADAYAHPELRWYSILTGMLGAALTLTGPGMWSVDARLFGWKRLEIPDRKARGPPT